MTGQPPNTVSQSPERGQPDSLRSHAATNGRLAGAAAMLTHGVARVSLHHWQSGLRSRSAHPQRSTPLTPANPSYSLAVTATACSGANHADRNSPYFCNNVLDSDSNCSARNCSCGWKQSRNHNKVASDGMVRDSRPAAGPCCGSHMGLGCITPLATMPPQPRRLCPPISRVALPRH